MMQNNANREKILLFIPCYNCEKHITQALDQVNDEVGGYLAKVIIVNNRSTDNTEQAILHWAREHRHIDLALLRNDDNYSLGGSHKVAFEYALRNGFEYVIVLHGDAQGNIHDLLPLLRSRAYRDFDCCLGSRFMKGARLRGYSLVRTAANRVFNLWFSLATGRHIRDLGSGLNMYKTASLKNRYYLRYPDKMFFNDVMLLAAAYYKQKTMFFPISWKEDGQVSNVKLFNFGLELLKMSFRYIFWRKSYMHNDMRHNHIYDYTYSIVYENSDIADDINILLWTKR